MNFVADEGVDAAIVELLRSNKYEVHYIAESEAGFDDESVLQIANETQSILITQDKDFGELVFRLRKIHHGVILIRMEGLKPLTKARIVKNAIDSQGDNLLNAFTVISPGAFKIRKEE